MKKSDQLILSDYKGKPYAIIITVFLVMILMIYAGAKIFMFFLNMFIK